MILLDTNVLSALMRQTPEAKVVSWLDHQPSTSIWTSAITVLEIRFGLQVMTAGKRRSLLVETFDQVLEKIGQRVAPFDTAAARQAGDLMAERQRQGRPTELRDTMIAGIALAQHAMLATRNTTHFEDVLIRVIDPWTE